MICSALMWGQRAMCSCRSDKLGKDLVEAQAESVEAFPQYAVSDLRFLERIRPGVHE